MTTKLTLKDKILCNARQPELQDYLSLLDIDMSEDILSYSELIEASTAWAFFYKTQNLQPGDRVIVILPHSRHLYASFLGALLGEYVPAMYAFPSIKFSYEEYFKSFKALLQNTQPSYIVTYSELKDKLDLFIDDIPIGIPENVDVTSYGPLESKGAREPADIAFLQYSSGTTGIKKGVAISSEAILWQIDKYAESINLNNTDKIVSWLPLYHDMGLIACFFLPILTRTPLIAMSPIDWVRKPEMLLHAISRHNGTLCWLPNFSFNFMATRIQDDKLKGVNLSALRGAINCAEPVQYESQQAFTHRFSNYGFNANAHATCYAMAENTFAITSGGFEDLVVERLDSNALTGQNQAVPAAADASKVKIVVSSGKALPETDIIIVDQKRNPLPERMIGEIAISSPCLLKEYYNNPDETADAICDGFYYTGDLGYLAEGELFVTGRAKDIIIVNGKNIYPQDLEYILNNIPQLIKGRNAVFGVYNDNIGTEDIIILAEAENYKDINLDEIKRLIFSKVAAATEVVPVDITILPPRWLVKSSSGKISRNGNRSKYLNNLQTSCQIEPSLPVDTSMSGAEQIVYQCLMKVVAKRHHGQSYAIQNDASILKSGLLDSLSLVDLITTIEFTCNKQFPTEFLNSIENWDSIREIAKLVEKLDSFRSDLTLADYIGDTNERNVKCFYFDKSSIGYDLLILGTSRMMALHTDVAAEYGFSAFNFSINNAYTDDWYAILRFILDHPQHKIRHIVLGVDVYSFCGSREQRLLECGELIKYIDPGYNHRKEACGSDTRESKIHTFISRGGAQPSNYLFDSSGNMSIRNNDDFNRRLPLILQDKESRNVTESMKYNGIRQLNDVSKYYFEQFIDVCMRNGISVFVLNTPLHESLTAYLADTTYSALKEYLNNYLTGFQSQFYAYEDLSDIRKLNGFKDDFYDPTHLGAVNSDKLLRYVMNSILVRQSKINNRDDSMNIRPAINSKKLLLLVVDINDHSWLSEFWRNRSPDDEVVVVAPTFDGRLIADSLGIPCKSYEDIAWGLDKPAIQDTARHKARYWHKLPSLKNSVALQSVLNFNGYPLLVMHQSLMLLGIQEIIQAHQFIHKIVAIEKPDSIQYGNRNNPFLGAPIEFISGSNGVEREVVWSIISRSQMLNGYSEFIKSVKFNRPDLPLEKVDPSKFVWPANLTGPKILIFAWSDYYLEYFERTLDLLLQHKARICIVIIGGGLTSQQQDAWRDKGICSFQRASWVVQNQDSIWELWRAKCEQAVKSIYESTVLADYFSDEHGTYYPGLVSDLLGKQILDTPSTVIALLQSESIIKAFDPDMVLNHFSYHPLETCDVLPARMLGIPTLSMDHGINGYTDSQRLTFATQFYGVSGRSFRDGVCMATQTPAENLPVVGNARYDLFQTPLTPRDHAKRKLGFDPDRPLCIFCDSSGWSHMNEWRHSTHSTVESIVALKRYFPDLQIIFRVHHGADYKGMSAYFANLDNPDIHFQISPNPPLRDILPAADVVISHYTSAIAESLLSGVPVIYLTACGETEPSFFGCDAIRIADSFEVLPGMVADVLSASLTREEVKQQAQPYFEVALAGNDGKASERLAKLILELASLPRSERKPGFHDWLKRINASCSFDTKEFRKLVPNLLNNSKRDVQSVSIIIPSYNRDKMLGITLESFINQDFPRDRYEIIVADNHSTDDTKAVVLEWQKKSPVAIKYIYEERQGVHFARNSAAKQANGEILYFTDDDMIAEPDLLSELVKVFKIDPRVGTATGRVLPKWEIQPPDWILQLCYNGWLSIFDSLGDGTYIDETDFGVYSCHQAIRREALFKAGGFNPESTYTDYVGDGETGLSIKLKDIGYKFGYNGKSVIHHMIPASRMTQDYLNKRLANQGSADCYTEYKKHRFSSEQLADRVQGYVSSLIEKSSLCVDKRLIDDVRWHMDKAYTHYYLSRIEYDLRLMKDPDWRELVLRDDWINE